MDIICESHIILGVIDSMMNYNLSEYLHYEIDQF